jgi:hypothetical protein
MDFRIGASMKRKGNFATEAWRCKLRGTWIPVASTRLVASRDLADVCSITDVYASPGLQGATPINRWDCCNCDIAANLLLDVHAQPLVSGIFQSESLHLSNWGTLLKYYCRNTINFQWNMRSQLWLLVMWLSSL